MYSDKRSAKHTSRSQKKEENNMAHHYQKKWVFAWNANNSGDLPDRKKLSVMLDALTVEGVFQLEQGLKTARLHYQGRFKLRGARLGKKRLLELFRELSDVSNLTFEPEVLYDSSKYCTKDETRVSGPWYVGTNSYKTKQQPKMLELRNWQEQLLAELERIYNSSERDRKVIWLQNVLGGAGKSRFLRHLSFGQQNWKVKKLPVDKPDRIRMAVCKIVQKEDVDIFTFDFTKTRGEETSMNDLFQAVEEIKNSHVSSVFYGQPMEVAFDSPLVLIATNERLEDYRHYLADDRWAPYAVGPDGVLTHMIYNPVNKSYDFTPVEKINNKGSGKPKPTFKGLTDLEQKWIEEIRKNPQDL